MHYRTSLSSLESRNIIYISFGKKCLKLQKQKKANFSREYRNL